MSIYHQILGIDENASAEEVKQSYRTLCKKYHPDLSNDESIRKMALINEAYDTLYKKNEKDIEKKDGNQKTASNVPTVYKDQAYAFYRKGITLGGL